MKIEKGMFIRHGFCSIYFEVEEVFSNMVICASRDPKKKTELVFIDDINNAIFDDGKTYFEKIKLNREKNFYDKFHPEGWQEDKLKVVKNEELLVGDLILTEKGASKVVKKGNNNKWFLEGRQKTFSGSYVSVVIQVEGKVGEAYKNEYRANEA